MSTYFVGDVHGCYKNLRTILDCVSFDPNIDVLYLTGDLVSRGPNSLDVLRLIKNFGNRAKTVLGNHDLHLLKVYFGVNQKKIKDCFSTILHAPDIDELMHWLCHQPILHVDEDRKILLSHAGVNPKWTINQAKLRAQEIETILISKYPNLLFDNIAFSEKPKSTYVDTNRLKKIQNNINSFTRMRYVKLNGQLDFQYKDIPENSPKNIYPWFNLSTLITPGYSIIFGHWAALKNIKMPFGIYGLDSGCCWGGDLTLLRWEDKKIIRTPCSPPA